MDVVTKMDAEHGFSEEQLEEMAAELMSCAATAVHSLCAERMEEAEVNALIFKCSLFVTCATAVEVITKEEFIKLATIGYDEMLLMQRGGEWVTNKMQ